MKRPRTLLFLILLSALLAAAYFFIQSHCPSQGLSFSPSQFARDRLKNRTVLPQEADFDPHVTLVSLLQGGEDRARWSSARAARIEGYVVAVTEGGIESANCFSLTRRDTHIEVALSLEASWRVRVILEVTPCLRQWMHHEGQDWSTSALRQKIVGRRCRFEGWLFFDSAHAGESEHIALGNEHNWRATAWEIHPVTSIEVIE